MAGMKNSRAITNCDGYVDDLDLGTTNPSARFRGYSGTVPTTVDNGLSGNTLLFECVATAPGSGGAFGSAVDINPGARATANAIADDTSADAGGTLSFVAAVDRDGTLRHIYTVSTTGGGGECQLASLTIVAGQTVQFTSLTVTVSEGP